MLNGHVEADDGSGKRHDHRTDGPVVDIHAWTQEQDPPERKAPLMSAPMWALTSVLTSVLKWVLKWVLTWVLTSAVKWALTSRWALGSGSSSTEGTWGLPSEPASVPWSGHSSERSSEPES